VGPTVRTIKLQNRKTTFSHQGFKMFKEHETHQLCSVNRPIKLIKKSTALNTHKIVYLSSSYSKQFMTRLFLCNVLSAMLIFLTGSNHVNQIYLDENITVYFALSFYNTFLILHFFCSYCHI